MDETQGSICFIRIHNRLEASIIHLLAHAFEGMSLLERVFDNSSVTLSFTVPGTE